jgi:hypothetical protein
MHTAGATERIKNSFTIRVLLSTYALGILRGSKMAEQPNQDAVYKVTVVNSKGAALVAYVTEATRQTYVRSMREEYGNAKVEQISIEDLPEGVNFKS